MKPITFAGNFVFLNVSRLYRVGMSEAELYDITRQAWRVAPCRRERVQYAAAVQGGLVRAVYRVRRWRPCAVPKLAGRWEFEQAAPEAGLRERYVGQPAAPYMPPGSRFVVQYNFECR
ncbi:hypothetical protein EJV47_11210 [Hymenobacter gummosus]|uniref:Uncharacterized protein n=1 Tax=Hymenobacter gummosus TaxID=1776032 RepID=A0A3S0JEN9_9BACT|nr:hypothetical protein [Hymenobacter gummosus]RTQ50195.1 hypothetical protein EJV47_11210 [Hymenobacter gummosus]